MKIKQPTLIIKEKRVRKNIREMAAKAKKSRVLFRPHFKTHQSADIAEWFKEEGITAITVSSVRMAEYFAENNWNDISIAFPTNILEIERINKLASKITLHLLVESEETVTFLSRELNSEVKVWIKVDTAYHRTGISWDNNKRITKLVRSIKESNNMSFEGLLTHAGHSYKASTPEVIKDIYDDTLFKMIDLKEKLFVQGYAGTKISIGDTPTCTIVSDFTGADEIRPGNFVFYDLKQYTYNVCTEEQIAIALACPVVAKHPERDELVIYGGGIHLSKEYLTRDSISYYGLVAFPKGDSWGKVKNKFYVKSLSQEHGIIKMPAKDMAKIAIGDVLYIIPVHSCMTANLIQEYYTDSGRSLNFMKNCP